MIALLTAALAYGANRPITGRNAGGTLFLVLIAVVWIVAAIVELIGKVL